jgi:hypothetical protein
LVGCFVNRFGGFFRILLVCVRFEQFGLEDARLVF